MELERGTFENLQLIEHISKSKKNSRVVRTKSRIYRQLSTTVSYGAIYATVFNSAHNRFVFCFHFDKQVENAFSLSGAASYGFFFYADDRYVFMG